MKFDDSNFDELIASVSQRDICDALAELSSGADHDFREAKSSYVAFRGQLYTIRSIMAFALKKHYPDRPMAPSYWPFKGSRDVSCRKVIDKWLTIVKKGSSIPPDAKDPCKKTDTVTVRLRASDGSPVFDPIRLEDERNRIEAMIVSRQDQGPFRDSLLTSYDRRCAISGCQVEQTLEAAHIVAYLGEKTDHVTNGILLRSDIHTLFDKSLLAIDPIGYRVLVASELDGSEYEQYRGRVIGIPRNADHQPHPDFLAVKLKQFADRK